MKQKNSFAFFRTMRFGMILLVIILIFCFAGSMIVQGGTEDEYVLRYGETAAKMIQALALDHVFSSPCFLAVALALFLNLTDCSVTRWKNTLAAWKNFMERGRNVPLHNSLDPSGHDALVELLKKKHFKEIKADGRSLYFKNRAGFWGSFCTHLGLLLVLVVGTLTLTCAKVQDVTIPVGETEVLEDGTQISVFSFRVSDEGGKTDYVSKISVTLPDGRVSGEREIRVNDPLRMGKYKIYQQSYARYGKMEIVNETTGEGYTVQLDDSGFYTLDGETGYYYEDMYFGFEPDESGNMKIVEDSSRIDYSRPVYVGYKVTEEGMSSVVLFPGEEVSVGGITCRAEEAVTEPGLRVKELPGAMLAALYFVFAFLVASLWLCFFRVPVCVAVGEKSFEVVSPHRQEGLLLELESAGIWKESQIH